MCTWKAWELRPFLFDDNLGCPVRRAPSDHPAHFDPSPGWAHIGTRDLYAERRIGGTPGSRCYVLSATTLTRSRVLSMSRWLRRSRRNPPNGRQIFVKRLSPRSNDSVTSVPPSLLERNSYRHVF